MKAVRKCQKLAFIIWPAGGNKSGSGKTELNGSQCGKWHLVRTIKKWFKNSLRSELLVKKKMMKVP